MLARFIKRKRYQLHGRAACLRDTEEHLDFHAEQDDYLASLATAIGFLEDGLRTCGSEHRELALAQELRHDLQYLHSRYKLVPKAPEDRTPIRPRGNLLGGK